MPRTFPNALAAAAAIAVLVVAAPAAAQVFKCVDPNGRVTYQQTPCPASHRGGPLELALDNGSSRDSPEAEARWRALAEQHDVATGMPKRWVEQSLGAASEQRAGTTAEAATEVLTFVQPTQVMKVGLLAGVVAWSRAESTLGTGTGATVENADAARSRVAADRSCDEVFSELGLPQAQEPARVVVGTGGSVRTAEGVRYSYEPVPGGLPARLSFVCVDGRVVSVARDVAR
jgi:hypothetical protein